MMDFILGQLAVVILKLKAYRKAINPKTMISCSAAKHTLLIEYELLIGFKIRFGPEIFSNMIHFGKML